MRILAVGNHKGGTGKTSTVHNLGAVLASDCARRVLLVDLDPQASLTASCGAEVDAGSLADVIGGAGGLGGILQELAPGLTLAPSALELAAVELGLAARAGRESVLRAALGPVARRFDIALIDCPPGLGLLTVNALVAADSVLIPTQATGQDLRGLRLFLGTVDKVQSALNPRLSVLGILPTFYDGRLSHHRAALEAMQGAGLPVLGITVGRSVRVAEAAAAGLPITVYEPSNPQAQAYRQLAGEVAKWLDQKQSRT